MWAIVCMSLRSYLCIVYIGNHCLINAVLYMWVVVLLKFGPHGIDERENLLQSVVPRLIPQMQVGVVNKVQVPGYFLKSRCGA